MCLPKALCVELADALPPLTSRPLQVNTHQKCSYVAPSCRRSTVHTEVGCPAKFKAGRSTFPSPRLVRRILLCPDRPCSKRRCQERIESVLSNCRRAWLQQICTRLSTQQPSFPPAHTRPVANGICAWCLKHSHDCVFWQVLRYAALTDILFVHAHTYQGAFSAHHFCAVDV